MDSGSAIPSTMPRRLQQYCRFCSAPVPAQQVFAQLTAIRSGSDVAEGARGIRTLAALRDTLLPKLISGELRVKDAERALTDTPV